MITPVAADTIADAANTRDPVSRDDPQRVTTSRRGLLGLMDQPVTAANSMVSCGRSASPTFSFLFRSTATIFLAAGSLT